MANDKNNEMTGSEILIKALVDQGVTTIFGYPGGAVLPLYDALHQQNALRHILVRQEGGAVHGAEGYARSTGEVGVVLVTSGPGATNAVTGLTDAFMDSIPLVCITGQVPTHLIGNDAFQECDTTGITRPCTKHNYLVKNVDDLAHVVHEAFHVARSGRPGPVVIDLPKDVAMAIGIYSPPDKIEHQNYLPQLKGDASAIRQAVALLAGAKKPIFYCGGGVINSGPKASELLIQLVRTSGYPCTLTLMGLGAYPASDPIREIAVSARIIQSVAHHEVVIHLEADIVRLLVNGTARLFVQEDAGFHLPGVKLLGEPHTDGSERPPRIQNIVHDDYCLARKIFIRKNPELHLSTGARFGSV